MPSGTVAESALYDCRVRRRPKQIVKHYLCFFSQKSIKLNLSNTFVEGFVACSLAFCRDTGVFCYRCFFCEYICRKVFLSNGCFFLSKVLGFLSNPARPFFSSKKFVCFCRKSFGPSFRSELCIKQRSEVVRRERISVWKCLQGPVLAQALSPVPLSLLNQEVQRPSAVVRPGVYFVSWGLGPPCPPAPQPVSGGFGPSPGLVRTDFRHSPYMASVAFCSSRRGVVWPCRPCRPFAMKRPGEQAARNSPSANRRPPPQAPLQTQQPPQQLPRLRSPGRRRPRLARGVLADEVPTLQTATEEHIAAEVPTEEHIAAEVPTFEREHTAAEVPTLQTATEEHVARQASLSESEQFLADLLQALRPDAEDRDKEEQTAEASSNRDKEQTAEASSNRDKEEQTAKASSNRYRQASGSLWAGAAL